MPFPIDDVGGVRVGADGRVIGFDRFGQPIVAGDEGWPFWATSVISLYVLGVAGCLVAVRRLQSPARSER